MRALCNCSGPCCGVVLQLGKPFQNLFELCVDFLYIQTVSLSDVSPNDFQLYTDFHVGILTNQALLTLLRLAIG